MKGLLTKDFLVIAKQLKLYLLIIPVMAIAGGASLASIAVLLGAVLPMTAMAYDEQSKWNEYAVMMPYSKKDIVFSKYLLGYIGMTGAAALFVMVQCIITIIQSGNLGENLYMIFFSVLSGLLLIAVNTPILFKFGSQKGRFVFIAFLGLTAAVGTLIKDIFPEIPSNLSNLIPTLALVTALILNVASVSISLHIKHE